MSDGVISRRKLLTTGALGAGAVLSGCDMLNENPAFRGVLHSTEKANLALHRSLGSRMALAREFSPADLSPTFRGNGTRDPDTPAYNAMRANDFRDWTVAMGGLFDRTGPVGLPELLRMPQRTQITRHDCVEGWSAIGKWTGVPLGLLLERAGVKPAANFIVFRCADDFSGTPYYESIDMVDARHPQTILAHQLNDEPLPVKNGAPLRLRVERQLGYKHAKYVTGIDAVASLAGIGEGRGGFWEDSTGYEWYAGI